MINPTLSVSSIVYQVVGEMQSKVVSVSDVFNVQTHGASDKKKEQTKL